MTGEFSTPPGDTEPRQHVEAASAVVGLALGQEGAESSHERGSADTSVDQPLPHRFTEDWAMRGLHPTWVGFKNDGTPKAR